jgi:hypothetical protein
MTDQQMHIYEYIHLHTSIKIFYQNVSLTPETIIRVSYNKQQHIINCQCNTVSAGPSGSAV